MKSPLNDWLRFATLLAVMALLFSNILVSFHVDRAKTLAKQYLSRAQEALTNAQTLNEATRIIQPGDSLEFNAYVVAKIFGRYGGSNAVVFIFGACGNQQAIATMTNHQVYFSYGRVDVTQHQIGKETEL